MHQLILRLTLTCWLLSLMFSTALNAQISDAELEELEEQAFKQAVALVSQSIVRIQTVGGLDHVSRVLTGTGPTTGLAVSKDGYIISSAFNFISKPASVLVTLPDGRRFAANVVATDRSRMLTLLKIDAENLIPAQAAPKKSFRVGQWALALGRTYESLHPSVSVGIVSALNRNWGKAVQTDAKVSPVNYGGPLVDIQGRVMGVLVPLSQRGTNESAGVEWYDSGIGFAIPLEDILATLERLKAGQDLNPGLMGVTFKGHDLYGAEPKIDRVRYGSPAQKAGLKTGDIIVDIDGRNVVRQVQVRHAVGNKLAGDTISVTVTRRNKTVKTKMTLVAQLQAYESAFLGILPIREKGNRLGKPGVGVRYLYPDSPAAKAGLKTRDRIVRFNNSEVTDAGMLADLVHRLRPKQPATLVFLRADAATTVQVKLANIPNSVPGKLNSAIIPRINNDESSRLKIGRFTQDVPAYQHSFWAYVPDNYNADYQYTLMVWIHPNDDTMEAALYKQWNPICEQRGIIILAPKAAQIGGWTLDEDKFIKDMIEQFLQNYSIDTTRIFVHGFSSGGRFAYHLAFKHRKLIRGVAVAAQPLRGRLPENHPDYQLQFHLVCGDNDNLYPLFQRTATVLRQMKFPTSLTTIKKHFHTYPPVEQVREIGRWADTLDRI